MSETASVSAGIAGRYATALFELAREDDRLDAVERDIATLEAALEESGDFRALIASPLYARDELARAVGALSEKMELDSVTARTLGLMAVHRRLFVLPQLLTQVGTLLSEARGEVRAEVRSAKALTKAQTEKLESALKAALGREVSLKAEVDGDLLGGLVVRVGSRMIDTSLASRLAALRNTMKEVR